MSLKIVNANKNHIESITSLFEEVITDLPYYNDFAKHHEANKYNKDALVKKIDEDPLSVIIALENNKIVGFCFSRFDDMVIWLEWFGVCKSNRKMGIAQKIVSYLESTVKIRDAHKIWCDCRTENVKSINLLSKCGYLPICTITNHWYRQDFILWQKEID